MSQPQQQPSSSPSNNSANRYAQLVQNASDLSQENKIPEACFQLALAIDESNTTRQLLQINTELPMLFTQIKTANQKKKAQKYFESQRQSTSGSDESDVHVGVGVLDMVVNLCTAGLYEDVQIAFGYLKRVIQYANQYNQKEQEHKKRTILGYVSQFLIAENYMNLKRYSDAIEPLSDCLSGIPWFHYGSFVLSTALVNAKQYSEALSAVSKAIDLIVAESNFDRKLKKASENLSLSSISDDDEEDKMIELYSEYLVMRGRISNQLKDTESAAADFDMILSIDPNHVVARVSRIQLNLANKSNFETISSDVDKVSQIQPEFAAFANTLKAKALRIEKRYQDSCDAYDCAINFSKQYPEGFDMYDSYLEKALIQKLYLSNYLGAKQTYDACIERYHSRPEPLYLRGRLLEQQLSQPKAAKADYRNAVKRIQKSTSQAQYTRLLSDVNSALSNLNLPK